MNDAGVAKSEPREPPGTLKKRRMLGAERRETFLEAAARIVIELGPSAVTMEEVAARTGVNKRLGYRYFDNREALLQALLNRELDEAGRRARAVLSPEPDLRERITVNARVWLEMMQEHGPLLTRLMSDHDAAPILAREVNARSTRDWTLVLKDALHLPAETAEVLARIYLAGLRGAVGALENRIAPLDEIVAIFTAVTLAGADRVGQLAAQGPLA